MQYIHILGCELGSHYLAPTYKVILEGADILVGGKKLVTLYAKEDMQCYYVNADITGLLKNLEEEYQAGKSIVVLAEGDPFFFGIGTTIVKHFSAEIVQSYPSASSFSVVANRLAIPWHTVQGISLHGRDSWDTLRQALQARNTICVLTDTKNTPYSIAQFLCSEGFDDATIHIFDSLCTEQEVYVTGMASQIQEDTIYSLATVVIEPKEHGNIYMGIADEEFQTENALITKQLIRASVLSLSAILPTDIIWDIGGGSGAISIECASLAYKGKVCCIEKKRERIEYIRANIKRHKATIVEVFPYSIQEVFHVLPKPNKIIIGGGLHESAEEILNHSVNILEKCGRIVIPCVLLQTLEKAYRFLVERGLRVTVYTVQNTKSYPLGGDIRFIPQNPVYIIQAIVL